MLQGVIQESAELMPDEVAQRLIINWQQEMENAKASSKSKAQRQPGVLEMQDGKVVSYSPQCLVGKDCFRSKEHGLCLSTLMLMYSHPIRRCKHELSP